MVGEPVRCRVPNEGPPGPTTAAARLSPVTAAEIRQETVGEGDEVFPILFLMLWMVSGLVSAAVLARAGEPRLAWAPVALLLGPLWSAVALEQREGLNLAPLKLDPANSVGSRRR